MSMTIKAWANFSKRKNSTKVPATAGTTLTVTLKAPCSIEQPVFELAGGNLNYNYVQAFGHYYFVTDTTILTTGLMQIKCEIDRLATYKTEIGNSTFMVARAASQYDPLITDGLVPSLAEKTSFNVDVTDASGLLNDTGCYIITVANSLGATTGATTTYAVSWADIPDLSQFLWTSFAANPIQSIKNMLASPFDSIVNCFWLPINYGKMSAKGSADTIRLGDTSQSLSDTGVDAILINDTLPMVTTFTVTPPLSYQGDFRYAEPYQTMELYIPMYGVTRINPLDVTDKILVTMLIDHLSGDTTVYIYDMFGTPSQYRLLQTLNFNIAVDCPLTQKTSNAVGGLMSAISGVASAISGGVGGAVGAVTSGLESAAAFAKQTVSVKGSVGGRSISQSLGVECTVWNTTTLDPANFASTQGRPLMQPVQISTLSGYVQCYNASIDIDGHSDDKDIINGYLNGGFFYE